MITPIANEPRAFAWGSSTLIADLEGRPPSGEPEAEIWFGDHPGSPAAVLDGSGLTLDAWLARGPGAADATVPGRLPFLLKLLAAEAPLSIQVHPSLAQAREGFRRENAQGIPLEAPNRNYRDDNHKPEVIVALSERFDALAGLRSLNQTHRLLNSLGDSRGVRRLREVLSEGPESEALRRALAWLLADRADGLVADIVVAARGVDAPEFATELDAVRRAADAHPEDPGAVVALLMNHVSLQRGEALYVPAGVLHAHLRGLGVEIMAASDNVLRGGLTSKHVDAEELLAVVDARPGTAPRLEPTVLAPGLVRFAPGVSDFELARANLTDAGSVTVPLTGPGIVLCTAGQIVATAGSGRERLLPGRAAFCSAENGALELTGQGEAFVAMPGNKSLDTV